MKRVPKKGAFYFFRERPGRKRGLTVVEEGLFDADIDAAGNNKAGGDLAAGGRSPGRFHDGRGHRHLAPPHMDREIVWNPIACADAPRRAAGLISPVREGERFG
jgi:hypothetical protein